MQQNHKGMSLLVAMLLAACGGGGGESGGNVTATATADVSVAATVPPAVTLGQLFTASLSISNPGVTIAENVNAAITLPTGMNATAVRMSGAACTLGSKVSCRIPSLPSGVSVMEIDATATAVGDLAIAVEAISTTFDPNTSNNTQSKTTVVGVSAAAIQQAIDNATSGQTIVVDPGTYLGNLTFRGKDISLASRDGPATTKLIQPSGSSVVQMGTGGSLTGFTIVARSAGVQVDGVGGSVITGNVFDPSLWGNPGALGVYGVNAFNGATVKNNIFRNHSCNPPPVGGTVFGVVMFSSLGNLTTYGDIDVSDNVFEHNDCADIALGTLLPSANIMINNNSGATIHSGLPQPLAVVAGTANLSVSNVNVSGSISWSTFSIGSGSSIHFNAPVQTLGTGTVVVTGTLTGGSGSGVLTVQ